MEKFAKKWTKKKRKKKNVIKLTLFKNNLFNKYDAWIFFNYICIRNFKNSKLTIYISYIKKKIKKPKNLMVFSYKLEKTIIEKFNFITPIIIDMLFLYIRAQTIFSKWSFKNILLYQIIIKIKSNNQYNPKILLT